jgi:hypothetical protein
LLQLHLLASKKATCDSNWQPFDEFHEAFEANVSLPRRPYFRDVTFDEIALSEWLFDRKDESLDPQWHGIVEDSVSADVIGIVVFEEISWATSKSRYSDLYLYFSWYPYEGFV